MSCDNSSSSEESFPSDIVHHRVKDIETTMFTTNKPIVLGKFVCAPVRIFEQHNSHVREMESNLHIQVKIVEVPKIFEQQKINILATFTLALQRMTETVITLPKPLLIRPGHSYKIHMQQSPDGHCFEHRELETKVVTECGATIKFHNDKLYFGDPFGLIQELLFNPF